MYVYVRVYSFMCVYTFMGLCVCMCACRGSTQGYAHAIPALCHGASYSLGIILKCQSFPYLSSFLSQPRDSRAKQDTEYLCHHCHRSHHDHCYLQRKVIPLPLPGTKLPAFKAISRRKIFKLKSWEERTEKVEGGVGWGWGESSSPGLEAI